MIKVSRIEITQNTKPSTGAIVSVWQDGREDWRDFNVTPAGAAEMHAHINNGEYDIETAPGVVVATKKGAK